MVSDVAGKNVNYIVMYNMRKNSLLFPNNYGKYKIKM